MTAEDWVESDNPTDLIRKAVRNAGALAIAHGASEGTGAENAQDWLESDNQTILIRKLVHNLSFIPS